MNGRVIAGAAIAPDGQRIALTVQIRGVTQLYVMNADGSDTRRIAEELDVRGAPAWSPDGTQVAYVALRSGTEGVYRKASNGEGAEELLYKNPGFGLNLSDWSMDGKFLAFAKSDLTGGVLYILPLTSQGKRQPTEVFRTEAQLALPRFSPDGRYVSYISAMPGKAELFVRSVDPASKAGPWRISETIAGTVSCTLRYVPCMLAMSR